METVSNWGLLKDSRPPSLPPHCYISSNKITPTQQRHISISVPTTPPMSHLMKLFHTSWECHTYWHYLFRPINIILKTVQWTKGKFNERNNVSKNKQEYVCLCYCSITVRDIMTKPTYKRKHLIVVLQFQRASPGYHGRHHGNTEAKHVEQ